MSFGGVSNLWLCRVVHYMSTILGKPHMYRYMYIHNLIAVYIHTAYVNIQKEVVFGSSKCEEFYAFSPWKKELLYHLEKDRWLATPMYWFIMPYYATFLGVAIAIYFHHTVPKQMFLYILVLEAPEISCPLPDLYLDLSWPGLVTTNQLMFWNVEKWHLCHHMFPCKTMGLETRPMNG